MSSHTDACISTPTQQYAWHAKKLRSKESNRVPSVDTSGVSAQGLELLSDSQSVVLPPPASPRSIAIAVRRRSIPLNGENEKRLTIAAQEGTAAGRTSTPSRKNLMTAVVPCAISSAGGLDKRVPPSFRWRRFRNRPSCGGSSVKYSCETIKWCRPAP